MEEQKEEEVKENFELTEDNIPNGEVKPQKKEKKKEVKPTRKCKPTRVEEEVYNVEALIEKKGSKYLVKWENFPDDQNTWEPKSSIPDFILKFYEEDLTRLGKAAPLQVQEEEIEDE